MTDDAYFRGDSIFVYTMEEYPAALAQTGPFLTYERILIRK